MSAAAAPVEGTAVWDEVPLAEAPVDEAALEAPEVPVVFEPVAEPVELELVLVPVMVIRVLVVEVPVVVVAPEVEALEEVLVLVLEVEELWAEPVTLNCSDWARIPVFMVTSDWRLIWKPDLERRDVRNECEGVKASNERGSVSSGSSIPSRDAEAVNGVGAIRGLDVRSNLLAKGRVHRVVDKVEVEALSIGTASELDMILTPKCI